MWKEAGAGWVAGADGGGPRRLKVADHGGAEYEKTARAGRQHRTRCGTRRSKRGKRPV